MTSSHYWDASRSEVHHFWVRLRSECAFSSFVFPVVSSGSKELKLRGCQSCNIEVRWVEGCFPHWTVTCEELSFYCVYLLRCSLFVIAASSPLIQGRPSNVNSMCKGSPTWVYSTEDMLNKYLILQEQSIIGRTNSPVLSEPTIHYWWAWGEGGWIDTADHEELDAYWRT